MIVDVKTLFYPGAGNDISPLLIFSAISNVNQFFYCDYASEKFLNVESFGSYIERESKGILKELSYQEIDSSYFNQDNWEDFFSAEARASGCCDGNPGRCVLFNLQCSESENVFSLFYFTTDGVKTFEILLNAGIVQDIIVIQDHSCWGNTYTFFGTDDSSLKLIAQSKQMMPKYLWYHDRTIFWSGYTQMTDFIDFRGLSCHSKALLMMTEELEKVHVPFDDMTIKSLITSKLNTVIEINNFNKCWYEHRCYRSTRTEYFEFLLSNETLDGSIPPYMPQYLLPDFQIEYYQCRFQDYAKMKIYGSRSIFGRQGQGFVEVPGVLFINSFAASCSYVGSCKISGDKLEDINMQIRCFIEFDGFVEHQLQNGVCNYRYVFSDKQITYLNARELILTYYTDPNCSWREGYALEVRHFELRPNQKQNTFYCLIHSGFEKLFSKLLHDRK